MALVLYNLILTMLALPALPMVATALAVRPRYRLGLSQRLGFIPAEVLERFQGHKPIWLHAPSVGETLATRPFLRKLKERFPGHPLLLSCLTPTAYATVTERVSEADGVIYFPLDYPLFVEAVLSRLAPSLFFFTETEMWPNFLSSLQRHGIPTILVSGRFSVRTQARYRPASFLFAPILARLSLCCMQTQADAERLISAGAKRERVFATGNFKVDGITTGSDVGRQVLTAVGLGDRPLLIGASTHAGEEETLLRAYRLLQATIPHLLLLLAPRHPQRFGEVEALLQTHSYRYLKRSQKDQVSADVEVFLLDTLGELSSFYSAATLVFVGGSLVRGPGGHSVIEPALAQVPVCFGPYTHNFTTVVEELVHDGGGFIVCDAESLVQTALAVFTDHSLKDKAGRSALTVIRRGQGAVERTMATIEQELLNQSLSI
ncbi:MAG: 3-deoxy-D-manno-octulosonic acid transferase [Candidatus Binatia bacterium]